MKTFGITLLATVALSLVTAKSPNDQPRPRGVSKSKAKLYVPDSNGLWKCLDGSASIPFQAINDDYCDCPDGSDEPGTSACGTGYFYCENVGHEPAYIRSSRVNDGVCDPECCDGTDEYDGRVHCPNLCESIGAKARAERERVNAILEKGDKLRQEYSEFGKKQKSEMQARLEDLKNQTTQLREAVEECQKSLDKAREAQNKLLEDTRAERKAARFVQLAPFKEEHEKRLARAKEARELLYKALENLQENYNKNFHDMTVKSTVTGFEDFVNSHKKDSEDEESTPETSAEITEDLTADDEISKLSDQTNDVKREIGQLNDLLITMKDGYNKEYNDPAVLAAVKVAEDFAPTWDQVQYDFVDETSITLPEEPTDINQEAKKARKELEEAQESYNYAVAAESKVKDEIRNIERKLQIDLGKDEEFAKLLDQCFDFKTVEYTYQVCHFGNAYQKSSGDTSLGTFSKWDGDDYRVQMYTGGLKCWNGPERSVKLLLSCGLENEIVSVTEPEKCEYVYEFRTPAVCRKPNETRSGGEDEDEYEPPMPGSPQVHRKHDEL
ncbi:hypothetical protein BGW42_006629 [Actinomortierella wolfii]|nr:hypothetical protein BGW42_006629 [Actinomortierella wolfii]